MYATRMTTAGRASGRAVPLNGCAHFLATALNALLSKPRTETKDEPPARYAEIAYACADAMLVARSSGLV